MIDLDSNGNIEIRHFPYFEVFGKKRSRKGNDFGLEKNSKNDDT
jgi:hypothetical protein